MNENEFLEKLANVFQTDEKLSVDMELKSLEEWDSLAIMGTIAFLDKEFGVKTVFNDYNSMKIIKDIMTKAGI